MKIRGERECTKCHTRWSYYETGSVGCPACGSLRSVGIEDRAEHTDIPAALDLTPVRNAVDEVAVTDLADRARDRCRDYRRRRGFLSGGQLRELDDTYLAATELAHVADIVARAHTLPEEEELYFLTLLSEADTGTRPPAQEVPHSLRGARGLAAATAVADYRRDIRTWAEEHDLDPTQRSVLERLGDHATRIRMLDGDVDPGTAETLIEAARDLARSLRTDDETALGAATDRLDRLG